MAMEDMVERVIANQRRQLMLGALLSTPIAVYFNLGFFVRGSISLLGVVVAGVCVTSWITVYRHKVAAEKRRIKVPAATVKAE
ncbi:MAG: hypothetical protein KBG15_05740 [Kofleriaceae bacterium]|nr:hypothetical protein [Kofleriaceae bacterium]